MREIEVLQLISDGLVNREIGVRLFLSEETVSRTSAICSQSCRRARAPTPSPSASAAASSASSRALPRDAETGPVGQLGDSLSTTLFATV